MLVKSPPIIVGLLRLADAFVVILTSIVAYWVRHGFDPMGPNYWLAALLAAFVTFNVFQRASLYRYQLFDRLTETLRRLAGAWVTVCLVLIALAFFSRSSTDFSRIWAAVWFGGSFLFLVMLRVALHERLKIWRAQGRLTRNAVIVGAGEHGQRLLAHLAEHPDAGIRVIGLFDDRIGRSPTAIEGITMQGDINDLLMFTRGRDIDMIIVALPWSAENRLLDILGRLRTIPADLQLCPDRIGFRMFERGVHHVAGVPMLSAAERPLTGWNWAFKAVEDKVLAAMALVVAAPIVLAVAIAIKLDSPGPVIFRQKRYGFNNNVITVWKFRSMYVDLPEDNEVRQATRDDPRVTRVGAFLRRTSLDELPQIFNVLQGEMSMVGPRPHAVPHNEKYAALIRQYLGRHRVKPGITGWAQVHGLRGETETAEKMEKRVEMDLYYIDNWSLMLDLRILVMTLFIGFVHENAY